MLDKLAMAAEKDAMGGCRVKTINSNDLLPFRDAIRDRNEFPL